MHKLLHTLKQKKRVLLIAGGLAAAALCVILIVGLQGPARDGSDAVDSSGRPLTGAQNADNDLFANALSTGEYESTVLEETDDAGEAYVKETLFIGDSNTAGMINFGKSTNVTMDNGIGIVSMGVSHVNALKCVKFSGMAAITVPEAVKILQPRRIVITYGTNDYYMTPEDFSEAYGKALDAIETAYPYSDIIIGSIFPITSNCSYYTVSMPVIEKFNLELVNLARDRELKFLNWSEALKDPATGYCKSEYMAGDGVHLGKTGMERIFDYFRKHSLDGEDRRPKPLNPVPAREATPAGLLGSGPRTPVEAPAAAAEPEQTAQQNLVDVHFVANVGGKIRNIASYHVAPGATVGPVSPGSYDGFRFTGWSGGSGSFTVPADAAPGQSFTITAMFEATALPPGGSGSGTTDPTPGDSGSGTTDPTPGDSGSGTTDPTPGDSGSGTTGPTPGDSGDSGSGGDTGSGNPETPPVDTDSGPPPDGEGSADTP